MKAWQFLSITVRSGGKFEQMRKLAVWHTWKTGHDLYRPEFETGASTRSVIRVHLMKTGFSGTESAARTSPARECYPVRSAASRASPKTSSRMIRSVA
jgi:hypothetical protein